MDAQQEIDPRQRTLLLVDDEENILRSLRRLFRREGYQILTAPSGAEGLNVLEAHKVGVIVSDQRMPEMTGSEFLHRVKSRHPDTVRIILSGYTDLESVTESINVGAVFKFLTKPWDDELLCQNVREAFTIHELSDENQRLTAALQQANQELEARVVEKTQQLAFNLRALQISQDILEELPFTVIGIGQDEIVFANRRAREHFSAVPLLLGSDLESACGAGMANIYRQAAQGEGVAKGEIELQGRHYQCRCQCNRSDGPHEGYIMTLNLLDREA